MDNQPEQSNSNRSQKEDIIMRYKRETLMDMTRPLKDWLHAHKTNPYPTKEQKLELCKESNMTMTQICNWFANARRRLKHTVGKDDGGGDLSGMPSVNELNGHPQHMESEDSAWESGNEEDPSGRRRNAEIQQQPQQQQHPAQPQNETNFKTSQQIPQTTTDTPTLVKTEPNGLTSVPTLSPDLTAALSQTSLAALQSMIYQGLASNNPAFINQIATLAQNPLQNPLFAAFPSALLPFSLNSADKGGNLYQQLYQQYITNLLANSGAFLPTTTSTSIQTGPLANTVVKSEVPLTSAMLTESVTTTTTTPSPQIAEKSKTVVADSTVNIPVKTENMAESSHKVEAPKYKNNLLARYLEGKSETSEPQVVATKKPEAAIHLSPLDLTQGRKRFSSGSLGSRDSECISESDELMSYDLNSPFLSTGSGSARDSVSRQHTPSQSPSSDDISPVEQMVANLEQSRKECPVMGEITPQAQVDEDLIMKEMNAIITLTSMAMSRTAKVNREH